MIRYIYADLTSSVYPLFFTITYADSPMKITKLMEQIDEDGTHKIAEIEFSEEVSINEPITIFFYDSSQTCVKTEIIQFTYP